MAVPINMQRNDQAIYQDHAETCWDGTKRFQRTLANQVHPRLKYFDRVTPDWAGLNVLDLGCGGGFMAEPLAQRDARVTGVDPSTTSLEAARKHAKSQGLDITYQQGVGEAIPLETGSMDRVVCVDVLEHVQDLDKVLSEVRRVLESNGFTVKEPFVGMGPVRVNRRLDFVFGLTPFKWIMYLGYAIATK